MKESDVILTPLVQSDGSVKNRPAILLKEMPSYGDFLVCGVSTQLQQYIDQFDEMIKTSDSDFKSSGLLSESLIRLGFLAVLPVNKIIGSIGTISPERHKRLLKRLCDYLSKP